MKILISSEGRVIEFTDDEIATRNMTYLVEKAYGPNKAGWYMSKYAWFSHHVGLLIEELGLEPKPDIPVQPSQAKPSSFSKFWKKTQ